MAIKIPPKVGFGTILFAKMLIKAGTKQLDFATFC